MKGADKQIKTGQPTERRVQNQQAPTTHILPGPLRIPEDLTLVPPTQHLGTVNAQTSLGTYCMPDTAVGTKDEPLDDDKARGRAAGTGKAQSQCGLRPEVRERGTGHSHSGGREMSALQAEGTACAKALRPEAA